VLLSDAVKAIGFSVLPSNEPSEIARYAKLRVFHLMVLDYLVADTAALDVVHRLREKGIVVPTLITISNHDDPTLGSTDTLLMVLLKPFGISDLREAIRELCPTLFSGLPSTSDS
jgi:DNA-binding response OmpR family regulator